MPLARSFLVPNALIRFTREHTEHAVSIMDGTYEHLLGALQSGQADFLIGALRDIRVSGGIVQEHLFDDPLSIVVRVRHPLGEEAQADRDRPDESSLDRAARDLTAQSSSSKRCSKIWGSSRRSDSSSALLGAARAFLMGGDHMMPSSTNQVHYELQAGMLVCLPHPAGKADAYIGLTVREDWRPTQAQGGAAADDRARNRESAGAPGAEGPDAAPPSNIGQNL